MLVVYQCSIWPRVSKSLLFRLSYEVNKVVKKENIKASSKNISSLSHPCNKVHLTSEYSIYYTIKDTEIQLFKADCTTMKTWRLNGSV